MERRIEELTQSNSLLRVEKAKLSKKCEQDASQYSDKITQLQSSLRLLEAERDRLVFNSETSNDKLLLQQEIAKTQQLKLHIEMLENSRQSFQNTAMDLLKQSQKESCKMAFAQSQRSFEILKTEWQKEQKLQLELKLAPYLQKIDYLEGELSLSKSKEYEISMLKDQLHNLQLKSEELEKIHSNCEARITALRTNASPSLQEMDLLSYRVIELEERLRKRNWGTTVNEKDNNVEFEIYKQRMQEQLSAKNREISRFKHEIDGLINSIGMLKQTMM